MPAALTPALAVDYVRELSADVRAAVVLDGDGSLLAGPEHLAAPARAYLAAVAGRAEAATRVPDGLVLAARAGGRAIVVAAGPLALAGPTGIDARVAVQALEPAGGALKTAPVAPRGTAEAAAEAVISATQRAI